MNKKILFYGFALALVGVLSYFVYAATLVGQWNVSSCNETDSGLNYLNFGNNIGVAIINGTSVPFNVSDFCYSNVTIGEFVCGSSYGPQYANISALFAEDCRLVSINSTTNATSCVLGRCV